MKPAQYRATLKNLETTPAGFARAIGANRSVTHRWATGEAPIPRMAQIILAEALRSKAFRIRLFGNPSEKKKGRDMSKLDWERALSRSKASRDDSAAYEKASPDIAARMSKRDKAGKEKLAKAAKRAISKGAKITKVKADYRLAEPSEARAEKRRAQTKAKLAAMGIDTTAHFRAMKKK